MTMKPPPPMFPALGCVTASAKAVATAASTALPPFLRMAAPTSEAIEVVDTTIPRFDTVMPAVSVGLWARATWPDRRATAATKRGLIIGDPEKGRREVGDRGGGAV